MALIKADQTESRIRLNERSNNQDYGSIYDGADSEHGGNIYKIAEELGVPAKSLIDFSASINPLGISDRVKDVIKQDLDTLVNYPDPETKMLRQKLSEHLGIAPYSILCGNGSTELIYLIPRAFKPRKVLIPAPTFSEYERACRINSEPTVKRYELRGEDKLTVDTEEYISAMKGCDMAFLCNPNNPTGTLLKREEVLSIALAAKEENCLLIVDEAFIDFQPRESVVRDVGNNACLIVLRSMTKFYAITGLRIGYGVFHGQLIKQIKAFKEPWTVNNLAQTAAIVALEDRDYIEKTMSMMKREKEYMEKRFREIGIEHFPSSSNYYMLKVNSATDIVLQLRHKGILVRDCSNFKGLDSSYIRVAVKSHEQNEILVKELENLCRA
jgi:threonine-phosphate decarboxylase